MQYMVPFPLKQSENRKEKVLLWICSENEKMSPKEKKKKANPQKQQQQKKGV